MSSRKTLAPFVVALALLGTAARAGNDSGPYFNGTASFAVPFGLFTGEQDALGVYRIFNGAFPLSLGAGYRFGRHVAVGVHAQYAFPYFYGRCPPDYVCSGGHARLGLDGFYHFTPTPYSRPWVSLNMGYEAIQYGFARAGNTASYAYSGWDVGVQCGADYPIFGVLEWGPFVGLTFGIFDRHSATLNGSTGQEDLAYRALHFWIQVGFRLAFEPVPQRR